MAVAEAQASGVGVLMQNVRPDLADYVGPGFLFDDIEEAHRVVRGPVAGGPPRGRIRPRDAPPTSMAIGLLYDLWR